jgi:ZIP family zinc transporter
MSDLQIVEWFLGLHPVMQAFLAGTWCWITTLAGAAVVFSKKKVSRKFLDASLGFAAGVMIAASIWSLLEPSMEMADSLGLVKWMPATFGFILGALTIRIADAYVPHLHLGLPKEEAEGVKTTWRRAT